MNASLLGLFSGFPTHHFTDAVAQVLRENLPRRESLVFISAWPDNFAQNDDDSDGMHEMFAERGMAFADHRVIDRRTSSPDAARLVRQADCVFLMGGDAVKQMALIRGLGLVPEILASHSVILGVSAGSMNMGRYVADVWESKALYEGIGLTGITTKGHYAMDAWFLPALKEMSMTRPIVAMEDESAIFIRGGAVWKIGNIHRIDKGVIGENRSADEPELAELSFGKQDDMKPRSLVSQWYEKKQNVEEMRGWNPALKIWEREVIAHFPSGARLLDVGCGLGREAFRLADLGYDVTGIDISKEVITQVRQLSAEKGYDIPFVLYDGKKLPFPDGSFDVVLIWAQTFGLMYGGAFRRDYLAECRRVLKEGGLLSFSAHDFAYLKAHYPHCLDGRRFYPYAGSEIYWEAFEISELTQYARQAGFDVILCEKGSIYRPEDGTVLHCLGRKTAG